MDPSNDIESALENLERLHAEEESIRKKSLREMGHDRDLAAHLSMVHDAMDLWDVLRREPPSDADHLTVMHFGLRLFNNASAVLNLGLAGYYQVAWATFRDTFEVLDLLDFFHAFPDERKRWRETRATDQRSFKPSKIAKELKKVDQHGIGRRRDMYKILSEHAAHVTPNGFSLLAPGVDGLARNGPHFERHVLYALLSDAARYFGDAGAAYARHFPSPTADGVRAIEWSEDRLAAWRRVYLHAADSGRPATS